MSRVELLTDVPDSDLDELVSDFENEGATVQKKKQADGKWAVVAVFPNENDDRPTPSTSEDDN